MSVVTPFSILKRQDDRIKTDRTDACSLAKLHRVGELIAVWVADPIKRAMRDLVQTRLDVAREPAISGCKGSPDGDRASSLARQQNVARISV